MSSKLYVIIFPALFALFISSCGIINLSDLEVISFPSEVDYILSPNESISVNFSEDINKHIFESAFSLTGTSVVEGDFIWENNAVYFIPDKKLQPGWRYRLKIKGDLKTGDGRIFHKDINIPFYYASNTFPPVLAAKEPENASIADIYTSLKFYFSKPVKLESFEDSFNLYPDTVFKSEWNSDDTIVTVLPDDEWENLQYYRWTISTKLTDKSHIALPEDVNGSFLVQRDISPPEIIGIFPAADNIDGSFTILTELPLSSIGIGEHIAFSFSEAIDFNSLVKNFSISPSLGGYLLSLSPDIVIFYIDEILPPETEYRILISKGLSDCSGNDSKEWEFSFTPDIPAQKINSVSIEDGNGIFINLEGEDFDTAGYFDTSELEYFGSDTLHFIIELSEGMPETSLNERKSFVSDISLSTAFPPGVSPPSRFSTIWENETHLRLIYNGFIRGSPDKPVFYNFTIDTGNTDSSTPEGSYLIENISFFFLAEVQE